MIKICCTPDRPDYSDLLPEQKKRFGLLVNRLRKQGYTIPDAQEKAYNQLWCEEIPFECWNVIDCQDESDITREVMKVL
jgi:hypothetical protein